MFYRNYNLKRVVGLLGVALAMLSGIQQNHAFCLLSGCGSPTASFEKTGEKTGRSVAVCCSSQSCSNMLAKSSASTASASTGCQNVDKQSDSCPCPPSCWCHQSPEPLGLPTSASKSLDLLSQSTVETLLPSTSQAGSDPCSPHDLETTIGTSSIESVILHCAKLCRFLI